MIEPTKSYAASTPSASLSRQAPPAGDAAAEIPSLPGDTSTLSAASGSQGQSEVFNWQPQDQMVMPATTKTIAGVLQGADGKLSTAKVKLNFPLEREDGKFVYADGERNQVQSIAFANAAATAGVMCETFNVTKWAFPKEQLTVNADAGQMLNALYRRDMGAINGFHAPDRVLGRTVYSFASGDALPHELGHAILDALRPSYLGTFSPDVAAFHESFADMVAIHMALMDDEVVKRVVDQTGGDLSKDNDACKIAEEMGTAINHKEGSQVTGGDYLRNANNSFKWSDPATLPERGDAQTLSRECHNYSRLWTGAHYDVLKELVKDKMAAGQGAADAIKAANLELLGMLANLIKDAPQGSFSLRDMATSFMDTDEKYAGAKHTRLIRKVMIDRSILPADTPERPALTRSLRFAAEPVEFMSMAGPTTNVNFSLDNSFGDLAGAKVEVPVDSRTAIFQSQDTVDESINSIRLQAHDGRIKVTQKGESFDPNLDYLSPSGEVYVGALIWDGDQKKLIRLAVVD